MAATDSAAGSVMGVEAQDWVVRRAAAEVAAAARLLAAKETARTATEGTATD